MSSVRYKCKSCKISFDEELLDDDGKCPQCHSGQNIMQMCPKDHNDCGHDVVNGIAYCHVCGEAMCPICGSHDVTQISRVTGYLQDVEGWNAGKRQELRDRKRYTVAQ